MPRRRAFSLAEALTFALTTPSNQGGKGGEGYCVLVGSSAGLTYLRPHGPMVVIWTTVSSSTKRKCAVPGGNAKKLPAGSAMVALRSAFSPIPRLPVPDMTVTTSLTGCVCGGTEYPAGN